MRGRTLLQLLLSQSEHLVIDDRSVIIFKYYVVCFVLLDLPAVYLLTPVLALTERADIKIVLQYLADGDDTPRLLYLTLALLAFSLPAHFFAHSRRGNMLVRKIVGNFFVSPAAVVPVKNISDNLRRRFVNLELHGLVVYHNVAVGHSAYPLALLLTAFDDRFDLFGRIGNRHFIDKKAELNCRPVVIGRIINVIANRDNPHSCVTQIFQFHQSLAVSSGKSGEVLDDQNIVL